MTLDDLNWFILLISIQLCQKVFFWVGGEFNNKPIARRVHMGTVQSLQTWVHPLRIYNISNTNMLIRCKLCEGHFNKPVHKKKIIAVNGSADSG